MGDQNLPLAEERGLLLYFVSGRLIAAQRPVAYDPGI